MEVEIDCFIKSYLKKFPKMDSNIKGYVKNFPEPIATSVYHYKLAWEYLEDELGGVIGRDSSRDYFGSLEKNP